MSNQKQLMTKIAAKGELFYAATLINCVAVNMPDRELVAIPEGSLEGCFCQKINGSLNRETNLDHVFSFCSKPANIHKQLVYHCPYGLTNILVPVLRSGRVEGGLLAGPILNRPPKTILSSFNLKDEKLCNKYLNELETYKYLDINQIMVMSVFLQSIMAPLNEEYDEPEKDCPETNYSMSIRMTLDYMEKHYHEKITLEDVAKAVYVNPSYLSRIFNQEVQISFCSYLNNYRIEKSKELLVDRNINILDVCLLVGFENQSYYNKVFKKLVGITPGQFRKNRLKLKSQSV